MTSVLKWFRLSVIAACLIVMWCILVAVLGMAVGSVWRLFMTGFELGTKL